MRFTFAATATLFGAALTTPAPQAEAPEFRESVSIKGFYARKSHLVDGTLDGPVDSATFKMIANREEDTIGPESYNCEGIKNIWDQYRFEVFEASEQNVYTIMVIHQTAPAFGFWGNTDVPAYCRAGGNNAMICGQVAEVTADLHL
ncbi:hypothetical protein F5144DRAFT_616662 [Chaetomium tenue]|uniref:Uncharacterized protein n=1 Tax=Chaetomium tenue TaxID=1854479 RepID=A0ACB7PMK6_9PEZI|nr:hypothetical protein F5144DRAFT_616662 [Chaetomium globosum]